MLRQPTLRYVIGLLLVTLMAAACAGDETGQSTTSAAGSPTTSTSTTTTPDESADSESTTTTERQRDFQTVECGELEGSLICESYELIQRHYVDPIEPEDLVDGALAGLANADVPEGDSLDSCPLPTEDFLVLCDTIADAGLDAEQAEEAAVAGMAFLGLDPNSGYFDADSLDLIEEEQSGQIEGIGALVATEEEGSDEPNSCQIISPTCRLRIVSTIEGGPARAEGLQADDEFLRVDGRSIEGMTVDQVTSIVRGPAGSEVDLVLVRDREELEVTITRAAVQVPVVESERVGDTGYLRLNLFTDNADEQMEASLRPMLEEGVETIVLDLRNNPGGLLDTAIEVTSEFLDEGLVVSTESPENMTPYPVEPGGIATNPDITLYVLVNEGSASASEVVAGALSDADRATIVGEHTFGKNTVQQRFPLSNGGALKLTIARWLTPAGHDFGGTGIAPDVERELPEALTAAEVVEEVTSLGT